MLRAVKKRRVLIIVTITVAMVAVGAFMYSLSSNQEAVREVDSIENAQKDLEKLKSKTDPNKVLLLAYDARQKKDFLKAKQLLSEYMADDGLSTEYIAEKYTLLITIAILEGKRGDYDNILVKLSKVKDSENIIKDLLSTYNSEYGDRVFGSTEPTTEGNRI